jgi:hypothetical protein
MAWVGIFGISACSAQVADEASPAEPLGKVQQATVWTTVCSGVARKDVTAFGAVPTPYGTQPPGADWSSLDDTHAIQDAIEQARLSVPSTGTCSVEVYFPPGDYFIEDTLWVPSRVNLRGYARANTRIIKATDADVVNEKHLIELSNYHKAHSDTLCQGEQYIKISSLQLEMRQGVFNTSKPIGDNGHCIRTPAGVRYVELRDLQLRSCTGYGIGFQLNTEAPDCRTSSPAYRDITIKGVEIVRSGSDGIDMKQRAGLMNENVDLHDVCVGDIGWSDVSGSAAGVDLAGKDIWVKTLTHVSPTPNYGATKISGIHVRSNNGGNARNVTDSLIENFYVKGTNQGVYFDDAASVEDAPARIILREGRVTGIRSVSGNGGNGIVLHGRQHSSEGQVHVSDVDGVKLIDASENSSVMLSDLPPALPVNPACDF